MSFSKNNIKNIYPLTPMQEGMLFHALFDEHSQAYFQQTAWCLQGKFNLDAFQAAWNEVVSRHDILRTQFFYHDTEQPLQVILKNRPIKIHYEDFRHMTPAQQQVQCQSFLQSDRLRTFDLSNDVLMRISILQLQDNRWQIIWSHHHILLDGWSYGLILQEFLSIYQTTCRSQQATLPTATPFSEYIRWLDSQDKKRASEHWQQRLMDFDQLTTLPERNTDKTSGTVNPTMETLQFSLSAAETDQLSQFSAKYQITLNAVLQSMLAILLNHYSGRQDVVFGSVVSGRPASLPGIEHMVGNLINTIPVRAKLQANESFLQLAQTSQANALTDAPYHHYPLAKIQAESLLPNGLFTMIMATENYPLDEILQKDISEDDFGFVVEDIASFEQTHYDLDFVFLPGKQLRGKVTYNSQRYSRHWIKQIPIYWQRLATIIIQHPDILLKQINLLQHAEQETLFCKFNQTAKPAIQQQTNLVSAFLEKVHNNPSITAVTDQQHSLTYAELNQRANRLAHRLLQQDEQTEQIIGICLDRNIDLVSGLLGILKSGGAYLPLDADHPEARLAFQIQDAKITTLVTQQKYLSKFTALTTSHDMQFICLDDPALNNQPDHNPELEIHPQQLAYVIYTSGSTGQPKGTLIEHSSVLNLVDALHDLVYHQYSTPIRVALVANVIFDASVQQVFGCLLHGHSLHLIDVDTRRDGWRLAAAFEQRQITVADCTPSLLSMMVTADFPWTDDCALDYLLVGGEPLATELVQRFYTQQARTTLINVYGPTECCVDVSAYPIDRTHPLVSHRVPIGKPLRNVRLYLLNPFNQPVPLGVPGEIVIGGASLSRGYLNQSELSHQRFTHIETLPTEACVYRTGDYGRWLADGVIEFIGRHDEQVKIHGFRIELGEVEAQLLNFPGMKNCALTAQRFNDKMELIAYVVCENNPTVEALRDYLMECLPYYMIPSQFLRISTLPLTANGKIAKNQLPPPNKTLKLNTQSTYQAAVTDKQKKLTAAWTHVIGHDHIGIHDNYFALGGDSIKAIQIVSQLHRMGLKLEIKDLFKYPTIADLCDRLHELKPASKSSKKTGPVPLTPIQKQFFKRHENCLERFNHSVLLKSDTPLAADALRQALMAIQNQHGSLRLQFKQNDHEWLQQEALLTPALSFEVIDLSKQPQATEGLTAHANKIQGEFSLTQGSLLKAVLYQLPEGERLLITIHHLAVDGLSWRIILEDLATAYQQTLTGKTIDLPEVSASFADWVSALYEYASSKQILAEIPYWATMEATLDETFTYPENYQTTYGSTNTVSQSLSQSLSQQLLTKANSPYNTSTEDLLLAALARAFKRWHDHSHTLLLMEGHGRETINEQLDISRTTGWFTSTWPFILSCTQTSDIGYHIKSIKESLRRVPHRGLGYDVLHFLTPSARTEQLSFQSQPSISFNYLGQFDDALSHGEFKPATENTGQAVHTEAQRPCPIDISALCIQQQMTLTIVFDHHLTSTSLQSLLNDWINEIETIVTHCIHHQIKEVTPSDLTYSEISLAELEGIIS